MISKKGQLQYFLENAFRIGFLIIALMVFFLLINFYVTNKIDTVDLQLQSTNVRILYSDAIMLSDSNSQVHPGIIDLKKFNDGSILYNINYQNKKHATAKLVLYDNADTSKSYTAYLNKAEYNNLEVLASSKATGKGSVKRLFKVYPVTYYDGVEYRYGTLQVTLIVPNS